MGKKSDMKMKRYSAEVNGEWVPVWAHDLDEAVEVAEATYGAKAVGRVRPVVEQLKETPRV